MRRPIDHHVGRPLLNDGVQPVSVRKEHEVTGAAMRSHRSFDSGAMPAGSCTLDVGVRDAMGRVGMRSFPFR